MKKSEKACLSVGREKRAKATKGTLNVGAVTGKAGELFDMKQMHVHETR